MLVLSLLSLIIYSSFLQSNSLEIKNIHRACSLVVFYTIILQFIITTTPFGGTQNIELFNGIFSISTLTNTILILTLSVSLIYFLMSAEITSFYTVNIGQALLILFNIIAVIWFVESNNYIMLFIALEMQSYSIYLFISAQNKSYKNTKSGLIYFLLGSFGSIIVLLGLSFIYSETGIINMNDLLIYLHVIQSLDSGVTSDNILNAGYILVLIGLLFKIGAAPFHNWTINIYGNTELLITMWISLISKLSILTVMFKFLHATPYLNNFDMGIFNIITVFSLLIGAFGGLSQIAIKRLIAYSGLANIGYNLMIIFSNSTSGYPEGVYLLNIIQYSFTHMNWFLILIGMYYILNNGNKQTAKDEYINDVDGFISINPFLTFAYIITLASLIGIPPLVGFFSKYYILLNSIGNGKIFISIILLIVSGITTYFYSFIIKKLTFNINANIAFKTTTSLGVTLSYIISLLTMFILCSVVILDIYVNGSMIVDYNEYFNV